MSFKVYIYYCALCGGWAAFVAWAIVATMASQSLMPSNKVAESAAIGALLGFFVAGAVGFVDAVLNAVGMQRVTRVMLCALLGVGGGAVGATIGGFVVWVTTNSFLMFPGWVLVGTLIGASLGVFDLVRSVTSGGDKKAPLNKFFNGIYGGLLGGVVGGLPFTLILSSQYLSSLVPNAALTAGLVLMGLCVGLMIGLAQVVLKQAWVKVEEGFRPGREILLTRDETTIGRAEGCDLGLFGDNTIEKLHARIVLDKGRYLLEHAAADGETTLNGTPVRRATPLRAGDLIGVGRSVLSFGEKEKRRS
jgi:hypothetical protein